jgi:predicted ATPase
MKIAVSGTHCTGKSTYVQDFLKNWKNYSTPEKSYRDYIKEKNLPHSKEGTEESQKIILDALIDQQQAYSKDDNVIFDRCVLDNLAYSSWLNLNGKVSDKFLDESRILVRETLKMFDVIFYFPITKVSPIKLEEDELRDNDPVYRQEIDNIFNIFVESFRSGDGRVFPADDTAPIIEIFGNREERIKMTEFYINPEGKQYGEEQSLITDIYS